MGFVHMGKFTGFSISIWAFTHMDTVPLGQPSTACCIARGTELAFTPLGDSSLPELLPYVFLCSKIIAYTSSNVIDVFSSLKGGGQVYNVFLMFLWPVTYFFRVTSQLVL